MEPDESLRAPLVETCQRLRRTQIAHDGATGALALRSETCWTGIIAEVELPDASGLDLARAARDRSLPCPVLLLTSNPDAHAINLAHRLRAEYICKPVSPETLTGFLSRAIALERHGDHRFAWLVDEAVQRYGLTTREGDILAAVTVGQSRLQLVNDLGITENTFKTHVRHLLRKLQVDSLDGAARVLLSGALCTYDGRKGPIAHDGSLCNGQLESEPSDTYEGPASQSVPRALAQSPSPSGVIVFPHRAAIRANESGRE